MSELQRQDLVLLVYLYVGIKERCEVHFTDAPRKLAMSESSLTTLMCFACAFVMSFSPQHLLYSQMKVLPESRRLLWSAPEKEVTQGTVLCHLNATFSPMQIHLPSQNPVTRVGQLIPVHFRDKETEAQAGAQGQVDVSGRADS